MSATAANGRTIARKISDPASACNAVDGTFV
jgi:hypothetical protein